MGNNKPLDTATCGEQGSLTAGLPESVAAAPPGRSHGRVHANTYVLSLLWGSTSIPGAKQGRGLGT